MTMSPPARPEGMTLAQPIPVPMLTVLPPSSDTESWSCSPSPRPLRSDRPRGSHRSRTRTKRRKQEEQGCAYKPQWGKTPQIVIQSSTERGAVQHRSPSPSLVTEMGTAKQGQDSPSHDLLIPPSRSWSRSPSPSRRSRWSLRSLLGRDSDGDRCRLVCWIQSVIYLFLSTVYLLLMAQAKLKLFFLPSVIQVKVLSYLAAHKVQEVRTERPHRVQQPPGYSVLTAV
uniref:uncharacterized protein LOC112432179 n=1 Tax=Maylandia zebra TaxID=106582 RepID=UPI000D2F8402|nr:uncharacterized protein LOC112432179 [Maylandia zebra]